MVFCKSIYKKGRFFKTDWKYLALLFLLRNLNTDIEAQLKDDRNTDCILQIYQIPSFQTENTWNEEEKEIEEVKEKEEEEEEEEEEKEEIEEEKKARDLWQKSWH